MIKKTSITLLFLLFAYMAKAQSLSITPVIRVKEGNYELTPVGDAGGSYPVTLNKTSIRFDRTDTELHKFAGYNVSKDKSLFAFLSTKDGKQGVLTEEAPGKKLSYHDVSFDVTDPSLKIYVLNNGRYMIRSDIAHFDLYGVDGSLLTTVNNGSGSLKGETISKLATDKHNRTILIYNPHIDQAGYVESRIQRLDMASGQLKTIYDRNDGAINHLRLSADGMYVSVISGTHVRVMDVFGNMIKSFDLSNKVDGSSISRNDRYITCWYGNSIVVYNLLSGKDIGSTTLRGYSILYAGYIPGDHLIVGVSGYLNPNSNAVHHMQIDGIDLKRRKIAKGSLHQTLFWHKKLFPLNFTRESDGHYRLSGLSEPLAVKTEF